MPLPFKKMTFIEKSIIPQSFGSADPFMTRARCGKIQQEHDLFIICGSIHRPGFNSQFEMVSVRLSCAPVVLRGPKEELSGQENIVVSVETSGAPGREPPVCWQVHPGHPQVIIGICPEVIAGPIY